MIRMAVKEALKSEFMRARVGAAVIKGSRVLAVAHNAVRHKKGNFKKKWDNSLHAEQAAMVQCSDEQLRGATLFVTRVDSTGNLKNACPCVVCRDMIINKRIKKVVYSNEHGDIVSWKINNGDV